MAAIITSGTADQTSADQVVASGATLTLDLFWTAGTQPPSSAVALIEKKASNGSYYEFGRLTVANRPRVIDGAGTYRISRLSNLNVTGQAFGVDAD